MTGYQFDRSDPDFTIYGDTDPGGLWQAAPVDPTPPTTAQLEAADVDSRAASPADHAAFRLWCLEQPNGSPMNDYAWIEWRKATTRNDGEGRDVTQLPGLWDETDQVKP